MSRWPHFYRLLGRLAVPCADAVEWGTWWSQADRDLFKTTVGGAWISTVFIGIDYSFGLGDDPLIFETMAFAGSLQEVDMERCSTWEEAEAMHERAVARMVEQIRKIDAAIQPVMVFKKDGLPSP